METPDGTLIREQSGALSSQLCQFIQAQAWPKSSLT
jgi:hypothetical protein